MSDLSGTLFYLGSFAGAFAFGFPLGPSSIEMLRLDSLQRRRQASSLAVGAASMNAVWALAALAGLSPWLEFTSSRHQAPLFLAASLACALLAWRGGSETVRRSSGIGAGGRLSHFWMGALLGASYPMTFASWIMALAVLRGLGWEAPPGAAPRILFFWIVFLGYFGYLALLRFLFARLQGRLAAIQNRLLQRLPRCLLLGLALLFLGLAALRLAEKS